MTTTPSPHLRDDAYKNYEAAKQAYDASLKDDAANLELRAAEEVLAADLMAFAKRVIYTEFGNRINEFDAESIIQDAGTYLWQQLCRPESIGNGNGGFTAKSLLSTWAWSVVKHYALAQIGAARKLLTEPNETFLSEEIVEPAPSPFRYVAQDEIINSLNDAERAVFIGKSEGFTGHEIAEREGVVDSTIDYRWKIARKKIRRSRTGRRSGYRRGRVEPQNLTLKDRENVRKSSVK